VLEQWADVALEVVDDPVRAEPVLRLAGPAAAAADLARTKDSAQPAVLVRGLERFVTREDGPGAAALLRPLAEDLFL